MLELHTFYEWERIKAKVLQSYLDMLLSKPVQIVPVPYAGRRHGNGLNRHKKPHTIQERRHHEALMTDVDIVHESGHRLFVRAKRINLPNGYEDRDRTVQRSWKEHRKTQYK